MAQKMSLSPKQRQGVAALLKERDIATAATAAGVSERTFYRWMADPIFRAALVRAEGEMLDQAARRLLQLQDSSISVLAWCMADKSNPPSVRLRAAQAIQDYTLKLRELRSVEERITELEEVVYGTQNRKTAR